MGSLALHGKERYACVDLPEDEAVRATLFFRSLIFSGEPEEENRRDWLHAKAAFASLR
jgi:hypothetical protein